MTVAGVALTTHRTLGGLPRELALSQCWSRELQGPSVGPLILSEANPCVHTWSLLFARSPSDSQWVLISSDKDTGQLGLGPTDGLVVPSSPLSLNTVTF